MQQMPSVTEVTDSVEKVANSYNKNPWGTTVAISVAMLLLGIFFGRYTASSEIDSANKRADELQTTQNAILKASLKKNQVITDQDSNLQTKEEELKVKEIENDTLKSTLNQVGSALLEAKKPATKILNK